MPRDFISLPEIGFFLSCLRGSGRWNDWIFREVPVSATIAGQGLKTCKSAARPGEGGFPDSFARRIRTPAIIIATNFSSGCDRVVPFWIKLVALNVEIAHCGVADFDAFFVGLGVDAFDFEARLGCRCGNQLDHCRTISERAAAPVLCDVTKHAMLDLVPFRLPRWIVPDLDDESGLVGEALQLDFPQPHPCDVGAFPSGDGRLAGLC